MTSAAMTLGEFVTPFPKIGEMLRAIASVLESKPTDKALDRIAREGDFDYKLIEHYTKEVLTLPFVTNRGKCESVVSKLQFSIVNQYINFIKTHSKPGLSRNDVMPALVAMAGSILKESATEILSEHEYLLNEFLKSKEPIRVAFEWLGALYKESWSKFRSSIPKSEVDKTLRWIKGEQPPQIVGLFSILKQFYEHANLSTTQRDLCNEVFFVAKIFQNGIQIASPFNLFDSANVIDLRNSDQLESENTEKGLSHDLLIDCEQLILGNIRGETRDAHQIDKRLKELDGFCLDRNVPQGFNLKVMRLHSLFYVFSGDFEKAISIYKEIAPIALYAGENDSSELFKEALVIAAYKSDRPFFKRLKHQGIAFGAFGKPIESEYSQANKASRSKDQTTEDWEVNNWACRLNEVFPAELFFNPPNNIHSFNVLPGILSASKEEQERQPNLAKPNELWMIDGKTFPQLTWFTQWGDYSSVKKLLAAGADVNAITSSGESSIYISIEQLDSINDALRDIGRRLFDLLSSYSITSKTINTPINARKRTCLGCAIESGEVEVVNKLLELGADTNQPHSVEMFSPLYWAIQLYAQPPFQSDAFSHRTYSNEELDGLRRYVPQWRHLSIEEVAKQIKTLNSDPVSSRILKTIQTIRAKSTFQHYEKSSYIKIIKMLLDNGANPNQSHDVNGVIGYTPLMYSIEFDMVDAFEIMMNYGGNPDQTCSTPYFQERILASSRRLAKIRRSTKILHFLAQR